MKKLKFSGVLVVRSRVVALSIGRGKELGVERAV